MTVSPALIAFRRAYGRSGRYNYRRLAALIAIVVGVVAFGAAQASASSAPIVIPYAKTCDVATGHCAGTAGSGGTIEMQVTSFRATGKAAQLTLTEWITVGDISFAAEMKGDVSPAGFIVLNGTVTDGSFAGAQVRQRSNPSVAPRPRPRGPENYSSCRRVREPNLARLIFN
jgi:hypothetical protein